MPLLRFDLIKGRDKASLKKLLDVAHQVNAASHQLI